MKYHVTHKVGGGGIAAWTTVTADTAEEAANVYAAMLGIDTPRLIEVVVKRKFTLDDVFLVPVGHDPTPPLCFGAGGHEWTQHPSTPEPRQGGLFPLDSPSDHTYCKVCGLEKLLWGGFVDKVTGRVVYDTEAVKYVECPR